MKLAKFKERLPLLILGLICDRQDVHQFAVVKRLVLMLYLGFPVTAVHS